MSSFRRLVTLDRGRMLESLRGCRICTSWLHDATKCHQLRSGVILGSIREERGKRCNKSHRTSLHMAQSAYCQTMSNQQVVSPRATINPGLICPLCKSQHTFSCANGERRSVSRLLGCIIFTKKAAVKRGKGARTRGGCQLYTSWKHASAVFYQRRNGVISIGRMSTRCNQRALQEPATSKLSIMPSDGNSGNVQQQRA